jgi:hypothetical protein
MATDCDNFLIAMPFLNQSGYRLMAEVVKTEVTDNCAPESVRPNLADRIGSALFILSRLAIEDQLNALGSHGVCNELAQYPRGAARQGHCSGAAVFYRIEANDAPLQVNLIQSEG